MLRAQHMRTFNSLFEMQSIYFLDSTAHMSWFTFNSLFEMRPCRGLVGRRKEDTFNSLFEMQGHVVGVDPHHGPLAFNSLFEMHSA